MFVYASSVNSNEISGISGMSGNITTTTAHNSSNKTNNTTNSTAKTADASSDTGSSIPDTNTTSKTGNLNMNTSKSTASTTNSKGSKANLRKKTVPANSSKNTNTASPDEFSSNVPLDAECLLASTETLEFDEDLQSKNNPTSEFALTQSPNNALITGIRGCGKSHLIMTSAAFLTARNMSDLYRIVCIGDCRAWAHSDNPVAFFALEMMMAFRTAAERSATNVGVVESTIRAQKGMSVEDGNYNPPGIFTAFDDLRSWMEAVGKRQGLHQDLKLVIFIDQLEELYSPVSSGSPNSKMAARIFEMLINLKYPILITSLIPSPQTMTALPSTVKDPAHFAEMRMPAVLTYNDFDMFVEVFEASRKFTTEDDPLMHDLRMWTGAVPAQIAKFFTGPFNTNPTGLNVASRLVKYRTERSRAFSDLILSAVAKMDRLPLMHFLLQICRMILHIPSDDPQLSPGAAINGLESLFLPAALQKFYHPEEGIVAYRHIPTAVSPCAHFTLCDKKFMSKLASKWEQVLEAVLSSTLNSQNVCLESKRRVIRFYAQFKLFSFSFDEELFGAVAVVSNSSESFFNFKFTGTNQFNDKISFQFSSIFTRRVIFAGLSPTPILIPSGKTSANLGCPVVFIPGRTDFCFYDFFVALPAEKTLYAVTTCPFETMLSAGNHGGSNSCGSGASSTFNTATNAPLTPFTLLDMWMKDLKDAGYNKFSIKSVYIPPNDLLAQVKLNNNQTK